MDMDFYLAKDGFYVSFYAAPFLKRFFSEISIKNQYNNLYIMYFDNNTEIKC